MVDIKRKASEMGFTYKELATKMGVSQHSVYLYMNGSPRLWQLEKMARAMGIKVSELVQDYEV